MVDTGDLTQKGRRLARVKNYVADDTFCLTCSDGVADVNITTLDEQHRSSKQQATLTAVQLPGRYGELNLDGSRVLNFQEKPDGDNTWINDGFCVLEPSVISRITDDQCSWEGEVLSRLAAEGQLGAYLHLGFGADCYVT